MMILQENEPLVREVVRVLNAAGFPHADGRTFHGYRVIALSGLAVGVINNMSEPFQYSIQLKWALEQAHGMTITRPFADPSILRVAWEVSRVRSESGK